MKPSTALIILLILPCVTPSLYDESSPRKVQLEDIEEEHTQSERRSKSVQPPPLPPPLSQQPAKGQPMKMYPPMTNDAGMQKYHKQSPPTIHHHRYTTRAQQHVQPLDDQPTAQEADYQPSPAYHSETIVYYPSNARGQAHLQENTIHQQIGEQPSPVFYYSHDMQQPSGDGGYQLQFVPVDHHGGSDEQHTYPGPQVTVPSTGAANQVVIAEAPTPVVSYSHDSAFGGAQPSALPQQQQESVRYVTSNEIRETNNVQPVYGLPPNVIFDSPKDIEYAKPTNTYGPPPRSQQPYSNKQQKVIEYDQQIVLQKHQPHQQNLIEYPAETHSQTPQKLSSTYGAPGSQTDVFELHKDIEYAHQGGADIASKPAVTYGIPDAVGQVPQIQYGSPDAPFRRPVAQSNQNAYAPRRPDSSPHSNEKPFAVSFPYPPSFISITTKRPFYEKSTPAPEPAYNEIPQWQANVMPLHLLPPQESEYRSFGPAQATQPPSSGVTHHSEAHLVSPLIDLFHSRRAKSLLDSYIPSWLVSRMQEEHARQLQQQQQQNQHHQPSYAIPSPAAETGYNTIAYSTQFENIYGKNFKRSIQKGRQAKTSIVA